jgi:hypothetical protein
LGRISVPSEPARDPDEEQPTISFTVAGTALQFSDQQNIDFFRLEDRGDYHQFRVIASDEHGATDWQDVRVKEGTFAQPTFTFTNLVDRNSPISLEDPVCVRINEPTVGEGIEVNIQYNDERIQRNEFALHDGSVENYPACSLNEFSNIMGIKDDLAPYFGTEGYTSPLSGTISYGEGENCQYELNARIPVNVVKCTLLNNEEYPFPYIPGKDYHQYRKESNDKLVKDTFSRNPFLANNPCCVNTPSGPDYAAAGTECFNEVGCFENTKKYYQYRKIVKCSGDRGNICSDDSTPLEQIFGEDGRAICGDNEKMLGCRGIADLCQNKGAYSLIENVGWCYGAFGCENFCGDEEGEEIVKARIITGPAANAPWIGTSILENPSLQTEVKCGCQGRGDRGKHCDSNFNGFFEGKCDNFGNCIQIWEEQS